MKFLGFFILDGMLKNSDKHRYTIEFVSKKNNKIDYIVDMLDNLDLDYYIEQKHDNNNRTHIRFSEGEKLYNYLEMVARNARIPRNIFSIYDREVLSALMDGLLNASNSGREDGVIYVESKGLRDDIIELAALLGMTCTFNTDADWNKYMYKVHINKHAHMVINIKKYRTEEQYNGKIYCVEVPNHTLFVRRNGTVMWSGNSHRIITINFPKIAIKSGGDEDVFYGELFKVMNVVSELLDIHREDILEKRIEKTPEYLKFFGDLGWFRMSTMFSTIGITGIYETVKFMTGSDITDDDGTEFTLDLLDYINKSAKLHAKERGYAVNVEEVPAEQTAVTLISKDRITTKSPLLDNIDLYSNQYIPLIEATDMMSRIELSGRFMDFITGGGIVHINVEAEIDTWEKMYEIIKFATKSGVPHFAICYKFGKCEHHTANIVGQGVDNCPICGDPIIHTRARVIGYFSDIKNWHPIRQIADAPNRYYSDESELEEFIRV
jgi:hypothetical protein